MHPAIRQSLRLPGGANLSFLTAGEAAKPAVLLLHGFPSSSQTFCEVIPVLSEVAHVIVPDLPGFGQSDPLPSPSFAAFAEAISTLLDQLAVGPRFLYVHDFGAPVAFHIAMQAPEQVLGLIIQNANAHLAGLGADWKDTRAYWSDPSPENAAKATAHLTLEGTRYQYVGNLPSQVAARISADVWEEDWRVMNLPGRMDTQRALIADYAHHVARFDIIADYLKQWQPPALMLWGRHDPFFAFLETLSWMEDLPRMEAHIFDSGHFLLETHATQASVLMRDFILGASQTAFKATS